MAQRVAAIAALDDPVRRALYVHVAGSEDAVGRDAAASALDLSRSTAAFHLDRLAAEGLLEIEFRRLGGRTGPGAGRPAKLYRRAALEIAVSVPERHYDLAGEVLAAAVETATRDGTPVGEALVATARDTGRSIGAAAQSLPAALAAYGFHPREDDDGWALANCPFHRLALQFTELICGVNLELLRGVAEGAGDEHTMVLDPGPGRCCVRVVRAGDIPGS